MKTLRYEYEAFLLTAKTANLFCVGAFAEVNLLAASC